MITFSTITNFRQWIDALKKVKRGVYATVEDEIRKEFCNISMEQIRHNNDMILLDDPRIVIKLRLPDKKHHLAKKDGYRLIYLTYKDIEEVAFIDIYPKNGPSQQLDLSDVEIKSLINVYIDEKEAGLLESFDI